MRRVIIEPRPNLTARAREMGFEHLTVDGELYWDERAYYAFTLEEIERDLEAPTADLHALCLDLVERVANDDALLARLAIPAHGWPLIKASWQRRDPSLYGRFDFAYDGSGPAKLLEYNADTPTALYEASVFQWHWLEDGIAQGTLREGSDQFNSLHEALIARFAILKPSIPARLHMTAVAQSIEDRGLVDYLEDCAVQAGLAVTKLDIAALGIDTKGRFVDHLDVPIQSLFKLYPWEWLLTEPFGQKSAMADVRFIEPPWKAILSNKGILPLLWEMAPNHCNLLEAYFEGDPKATRLGDRYARKPLYSREGSDITLVDAGRVVDRGVSDGYGAEGYVVQSLVPMTAFDVNYPVIGSWIIGEAACGIGVREDTSPITKNTSRFIPHIIEPR